MKSSQLILNHNLELGYNLPKILGAISDTLRRFSVLDVFGSYNFIQAMSISDRFYSLKVMYWSNCLVVCH